MTLGPKISTVSSYYVNSPHGASGGASSSKLPTLKLCLASAAVASFIVMPAAYQNAMIDQPQEILVEFTNHSFDAQFGDGSGLAEGPLQALWGFMICISGITSMPVALLVPTLGHTFGIKKVLFLFGCFANLACAILECLSKYTNAFELFILGQMMGPGIGWTFAMDLAPVYLAECSPSHQRGVTGTMVSFGLYLGVLLSCVFGQSSILGTENLWGIFALLTAVPAIASGVAYFFFPESPKHLYMKEENPEAAKDALIALYGKDCKPEEIFKEYDDEANLTSIECSFREVVSEYHLRQPLIISVVAQVFSFVCGPMGFMSFSTLIFEHFFDQFYAQLATVIMAAPLPFLSLGASVIMEKYGRRPLLLHLGFAMVASMMFYVIVSALGIWLNADWISYVGLAGIFINMWISPFGPMAIGLFLVSEITPQAARTMSSSICVVFSSATHTLLFFLFPMTQASLGPGAVLVLMVIPSVVCMAYLWFKMPESKGRSISDIMSTWITPQKKKSIIYERRMSMLSMGRRSSIMGGRRVSVMDIQVPMPAGYVPSHRGSRSSSFAESSKGSEQDLEAFERKHGSKRGVHRVGTAEQHLHVISDVIEEEKEQDSQDQQDSPNLKTVNQNNASKPTNQEAPKVPSNQQQPNGNSQ